MANKEVLVQTSSVTTGGVSRAPLLNGTFDAGPDACARGRSLSGAARRWSIYVPLYSSDTNRSVGGRG